MILYLSAVTIRFCDNLFGLLLAGLAGVELTRMRAVFPKSIFLARSVRVRLVAVRQVVLLAADLVFIVRVDYDTAGSLAGPVRSSDCIRSDRC